MSHRRVLNESDNFEISQQNGEQIWLPRPKTGRLGVDKHRNMEWMDG